METAPLPKTDPQTWAERFTASLFAQRDRAREFLAAQHARLEQAESAIEQELHRLVNSPASEGPSAVDEELQRRYEMSLDDIRQLRETNAELQQQLATARSAAAKQPQPSGRLDWEAEKQRIMAAMEADNAEDDPERQAEHLEIAEVARKTDEVVAAKDHEIEELKLRLEESIQSIGQAENANSFQQAFDNDAAIREERERLGRLQAEWREKLRQAEIELSVERAKTARQRAELEEQLRAAKGAASEQPAADDSSAQAAQSLGGRWLAQLGLTAADRQRRRQL
jgi:hypothetical protein